MLDSQTKHHFEFLPRYMTFPPLKPFSPGICVVTHKVWDS